MTRSPTNFFRTNTPSENIWDSIALATVAILRSWAWSKTPNTWIQEFPRIRWYSCLSCIYEDATQSAYQNWSNYIDGIQLYVAGRPENLHTEVRNALAEIDPNLTVIKMTNLEEQVDSRLNSQRLIAQFTSLYGVLALVLDCVGLYGVASYTVARRTSEIGLRMAVGAGSKQVLAMVLRSAMAPIALGLVIGIPVVIAAGHAIASQLYGVNSYDPLILGLAIVVLAISAALAAVVPARRAASIDPMRALRTE